MRKEIEFTKGSGNVFQDLGLQNPEIMAAKADMIMEINKIIKSRGLKQVELAEIVGLSESDTSLLIRGSLRQFSVDQILQVLVRLGREVDILIKPKATNRTKGQIIVKVA